GGAQGPVDGGRGGEAGHLECFHDVQGEFRVEAGAQVQAGVSGKEGGDQAVVQAVGVAGFAEAPVDVVVADVQAVVVVDVEGGQGAHGDGDLPRGPGYAGGVADEQGVVGSHGGGVGWGCGGFLVRVDHGPGAGGEFAGLVGGGEDGCGVDLAQSPVDGGGGQHRGEGDEDGA